MTTAIVPRRFPRAPLVGGFGLVGLALLLAVAGRLNGPAEGPPPAASIGVVEFRVADRADGAVRVLDAKDGHEISVATGQAGFLRGILRSMARERRITGQGGREGAFRLTAWNDGRLTLDDLATGRRIDLEAFGSDNVAVFAHLLTPQGGNS